MSASASSTMIVLSRAGMGDGPAELQARLLAKWLDLLLENALCPGVIAFYADGVKLVLAGSPVLERLRKLEGLGVHLIVCKTCLDYYQVAELRQVGIVGGMGDIQAAMFMAAKVIAL